LADFQGSYQELKSEEITLIAASVDPIEKAREMIDKHEISYPVGYGLVAEETSRMTGAYYEKKEKYLHATGFLLRPDKTILIACYSTGAIGRLVPKDVLQLTRYFKGGGRGGPKG
jgi:peroxiredoxin